MSEEATVLDGVEEQAPAEVVAQEQLEQQQQQGNPAATEEPVGNLDDGDTADAATTDQEADGV
jgi:hypothetical protein